MSVVLVITTVVATARVSTSLAVTSADAMLDLEGMERFATVSDCLVIAWRPNISSSIYGSVTSSIA